MSVWLSSVARCDRFIVIEMMQTEEQNMSVSVGRTEVNVRTAEHQAAIRNVDDATVRHQGSPSLTFTGNEKVRHEPKGGHVINK